MSKIKDLENEEEIEYLKIKDLKNEEEVIEHLKTVREKKQRLLYTRIKSLHFRAFLFEYGVCTLLSIFFIIFIISVRRYVFGYPN